MEESIIMLIIVGVLMVLIAISFVINKNKSKGKATKNANTNVKDTTPRKDMSEFIQFDKIANDMIYQKKGEKYTMVIQCKGINYDLMSEIEQMAVEEGFIKFLNTLRNPIQLYVQTRSIDLSDNINKYKERTNAFNETYQEINERYNDAENDIDVSQKEVEELRREKIKYANIAEYASDITRYVEKMSLNKYMLQRKYYIILSYYKSEIGSMEKFTKQEYEEICYRELYTMAQGIISPLNSCSVSGKILNSNQLAELVYISYNRDEQKIMDVKKALESGFYRLYTTSPDVRVKKQAMLDDQIKQEALKRIEQAIEQAIEDGTIISEEEAQMKLDKDIDKAALKIVSDIDASNQTKEKLKDIITDNRRKKLEKIREDKKISQDEIKPVKEENEEQIKIKDEVLPEKQIKIEEDLSEINNKILEDKKNIIENNESNDESNTNIENIIEQPKEKIKYPSMNDEIMMRESMNEDFRVTINDELKYEPKKEDIIENKTEEKIAGTFEDSQEDDSIV